MGRGSFNSGVQEAAKKFFGYELTIRELRLLPYIQSCMMNEQKICPSKINEEERDILSKWRKEGHIEGGATGLAITKEFWDGMNEILFWSYVQR